MSFDLDKVAKLARIKLKPEEKEKLSKDLDNILAYIETLSRLDTKDTPPTSHVLALENVFRPDEVRKTEIREQVLEAAPERDGNFFKVPKIIEET